MKYASETDLRYVFSKIHDLDDSAPLMQLLDEAIDTCKELPQEQWQTIDEFKANPVDGDYHILIGGHRLILFYRDRAFWSSQTENRLFVHQNDITEVMPIKTPEAPK